MATPHSGLLPGLLSLAGGSSFIAGVAAVLAPSDAGIGPTGGLVIAALSLLLFGLAWRLN